MHEQGKLVTTIRERILTRAHLIAQKEPIFSQNEESSLKKIEAKQLRKMVDEANIK